MGNTCIVKIVELQRTLYASNGALAVIVIVDYDDGVREEVTISVNLDHPQNDHASDRLGCNEFFADVNKSEDYIKALERAGLINQIGECAQSGYVIYPAYALSKDGLKIATDITMIDYDESEE